MKITIYADDTEVAILDLGLLARAIGLVSPSEVAPPATGTVAETKPKGRPGRPPKAPVDTSAAAESSPPAAPAPANPTVMQPLCKTHAPLYPEIKAIPAEPSGCTKCAAAADGPQPGGKKMTLAEVMAVATALGDSRKDGWDTCYRLLSSLGAESLTGAPDPDTKDPDTKVPTIALDPEKYEEFARLFTAAMAPAAEPAKPAKRSL